MNHKSVVSFEEFWQFHQDVEVPYNDYAPVDFPEMAWSEWHEFRHYEDIKVFDAEGAGKMNWTFPVSKKTYLMIFNKLFCFS